MQIGRGLGDDLYRRLRHETEGPRRLGICIAAVGSFIASTFSVIALTVIAPPLAPSRCASGRRIHRAVDWPHFPGYMSSTSLARTLLMAAFGLFGCIGIDVLTGRFRYAFDVPSSATASASFRSRSGCSVSAKSFPRQATASRRGHARGCELLPTRKEWGEAAMPMRAARCWAS
jgi:hypothetical protein